MESLLQQAGERDDARSFATRLLFMSAVEKRSDQDLLQLARKHIPKSTGTFEGSTLEELLSHLNPDKGKERDELLRKGQQCSETLTQYLKRIKFIANAYYDEGEISSKEFIGIFLKGIHQSIKEKVVGKIGVRILRLSGSLPHVLPFMEEIVGEYSNTCKSTWIRPRNTCFQCTTKRSPIDLDELEESLEDIDNDFSFE